MTDSGVIFNMYNTSPAHSHVLSSFEFYEKYENIESSKPPSDFKDFAELKQKAAHSLKTSKTRQDGMGEKG